MNQPAITVIINNKPYSVSANNIEAIRNIPPADRQELIALLEAVKQQGCTTQPPVKPTATEMASRAYNAVDPAMHQTMRSERLSSGDVDSVMAQLIMEERSKEKPGLTKQTIYKWVGGITVVTILLVAAL